MESSCENREYTKQRALYLRRVRKDLFNKLTQLGIPRGQAAYSEHAKLFHSWYSVDHIRSEAKLIMAKIYSDRFIPSAKDKVDAYHQNNLICCCLMQLILPPDIKDVTLPVPIYFTEVNHDPDLRIEVQSLIYSKLSLLLDKPKNRISYHDDLIKQILRLERRVYELEQQYGISTQRGA